MQEINTAYEYLKQYVKPSNNTNNDYKTNTVAIDKILQLSDITFNNMDIENVNDSLTSSNARKR